MASPTKSGVNSNTENQLEWCWKKEELLLELRSPFDAHRNAIDHDKSPTKPSWYSMDSHYQRLKSTLKNSFSRLVFERLKYSGNLPVKILPKSKKLFVQGNLAF